MSSAEPRSSGRETRLLLVTIAVSVAALLLLARFRFPEQAVQPAEPAPAPLERLAARAAYDELASAIADLERRIAPSLIVFRITPPRASGAYVVAPRMTDSRAVVVLSADESLAALSAAAEIVTHDIDRGIAVLATEPAAAASVTPRTGLPHSGPRYVVVVEGSPKGPTFRPVYVGRISTSDDSLAPLTLLTMDALQSPLARGASVFALDGAFLGLVGVTGPVTSLVAAESLRAAAESAQSNARRAIGDLGLEVQEASALLLRAASADRGVVVSHVRPDGPAASMIRPGDVIRAVDDAETVTSEAFRQAERGRTPGEPVTVHFIRRGSQHQVTYRAGDAAAARSGNTLGLIARSAPGIGVEVIAVEPRSAAERAGLRRGDLILTLDGTAVSDAAAVTRAYRQGKDGSVFVISLERNQQHRVVAVEKR